MIKKKSLEFKLCYLFIENIVRLMLRIIYINKNKGNR